MPPIQLLKVQTEPLQTEPLQTEPLREVPLQENPLQDVNAETVGKKLKYDLSNLSCASCAIKIETAIMALPEIERASLRFAAKKLVVQLSAAAPNQEEMTRRIIEIVHRYEPEVGVTWHGDSESGGQASGKLSEKEILRRENLDRAALVAGAVFFATALISRYLSLLPDYVSIGLYVLAYLLVGHEVLYGAYTNLRQGNWFEEKFLMSLATFSAWAIGEYPEAVAVMLFFRVGEWFEDYAVNKSRRSIAALMNIKVEETHLIEADVVKDVDTEFVRKGSLILVKPGERIPLDGVVESGKAVIDTSAITGESLPVSAEPGTAVYGGSINKSGLLKIRTTADFDDSTVGRILELIESASDKKANTEKFITRFAKIYTPAVVLIAITIALIPPLITGGNWMMWLYRASIFLVVSCPCALVISVPLGYFGGIGRASSRGILVKGGNYLETLVKVDTVFLDKTGTITEGKFKVSKIHGHTRDIAILEAAAALENDSNHPIARAIVEEALSRGIVFGMVTDYEEIAGRGIKAVYDGRLWYVGSAGLLEDHGITVDVISGDLTRVHVAVDGSWLGAIDVSDQIKPTSKRAIENLRKEGIKNIIMLTGDNKEIAGRIGAEAGTDHVLSALLPDGKVRAIEAARQNGAKAIFIGDGLNDAPALAMADVGIAMGGLGADLSIEAADIVIMNDDLEKVVEAIQISKKTNRVVKQNIVFALGIKALVLLLGTLGMASMWQAVFADVGVALLAILNSMRVHR